MTDKELWQAAWKELTLTTDSYPTWKKKGFPATSHWAKAKALGDQIGLVPPAGHPASWTTGPLGTRNIIPAKPGAFLIEYYGGGGISWKDPGDTKAVTVVVPQREQAIGRMFDGIHFQYWGGGYTRSGLYGFFENEKDEQRIEWIHARGQIPVVSWSPYYSISDVNAGKADAIFAWVANWWKSYDYEIMLRMWEFDNTQGFPWAVGGSPNIGAPFIAAWKRVVDIFKAAGADNVGFWFCPSKDHRTGSVLQRPTLGTPTLTGADLTPTTDASSERHRVGRRHFIRGGRRSRTRRHQEHPQPARSVVAPEAVRLRRGGLLLPAECGCCVEGRLVSGGAVHVENEFAWLCRDLVLRPGRVGIRRRTVELARQLPDHEP